MKILALVCRILLGVLFVVFGANGIHPFMHMPPPPAGTPVGDWIAIMQNSGWTTIISSLEVVGGLLVLVRGTLPFGLCLLCPITFNALIFHCVFMGGKGIGAAVVVTLMELVLIYAYRGSFAGILTTKAAPSA